MMIIVGKIIGQSEIEQTSERFDHILNGFRNLTRHFAKSINRFGYFIWFRIVVLKTNWLDNSEHGIWKSAIHIFTMWTKETTSACFNIWFMEPIDWLIFKILEFSNQFKQQFVMIDFIFDCNRNTHEKPGRIERATSSIFLIEPLFYLVVINDNGRHTIF